jgi:hypothetical protein
MNSFLDDLLVGLVLLSSVGYAIYSLGPRTVRGRLLTGASSLLGGLPAFMGLRGIAQRLGRAAAVKAKGSCGGCDNCGSDQPAMTQGSANEVRIPVAGIVKRQ